MVSASGAVGRRALKVSASGARARSHASRPPVNGACKRSRAHGRALTAGRTCRMAADWRMPMRRMAARPRSRYCASGANGEWDVETAAHGAWRMASNEGCARRVWQGACDGGGRTSIGDAQLVLRHFDADFAANHVQRVRVPSVQHLCVRGMHGTSAWANAGARNQRRQQALKPALKPIAHSNMLHRGYFRPHIAGCGMAGRRRSGAAAL